ncbi:MAG TPA: DNA polymerase IV [Chloroflexia bacterium]|nr:DNA polymerase IV [Chloroflexia bacterium]
MSWARCIIHLDLDAFYASVEEMLNPVLKGQPVIVVMGDPTTQRGAVATASYAARAFGVHSAMPVAQARKLCPQGNYLPVRHDLYEEVSREVMKLLRRETTLLEQVSIDEAYADITQLQQTISGAEVAAGWQEMLVRETGLTASVGVASNKLTAKMASGHRKPGGLTVVEPGYEPDFLGPLPVGKLHGIGPKWAARLNEMGIQTIADLAVADLDMLREQFGPRLGRELQERASGQDNRPIETTRETKSLSSEHTFFEDISDRRELWKHIRQMSNDLEKRLQDQALLARTVAIKLRFNNWRTVTRAITLISPTDQADEIATAAGRLMRRVWKPGTPLRLLGVRVSNFAETGTPRQLVFPYHLR